MISLVIKVLLLFYIIILSTSGMYRIRNINKNVMSRRTFQLNGWTISNGLSSSSSSSFSSSSSSPKNDDDVRVVTYNVLSSSLAEPDYFFT